MSAQKRSGIAYRLVGTLSAGCFNLESELVVVNALTYSCVLDSEVNLPDGRVYRVYRNVADVTILLIP